MQVWEKSLVVLGAIVLLSACELKAHFSAQSYPSEVPSPSAALDLYFVSPLDPDTKLAVGNRATSDDAPLVFGEINFDQNSQAYLGNINLQIACSPGQVVTYKGFSYANMTTNTLNLTPDFQGSQVCPSSAYLTISNLAGSTQSCVRKPALVNCKLKLQVIQDNGEDDEEVVSATIIES